MTASIRRQLVRIVEGCVEGGYGDAFEVVCCDCGDHPYWGLLRDLAVTAADPPAVHNHGRGPSGV